MANTWQGNFPVENLALDGWERTSPVTAFPANGYGLHDLIGHCWEWTQSWFSSAHPAEAKKACCIPENPRGAAMEGSYDPADPHPAPGHQGRLASLRAQLLPPRRPPCRGGGSSNHLSFCCVVRGTEWEARRSAHLAPGQPPGDRGG